MELVMVANIQEKGRWSAEFCLPVIKAQIENSLELGWETSSIRLVSNIEFEFMGVRSLVAKLNKHCLTGSKVFAIKWMHDYGLIEDKIWAHDLDVWQNEPIGQVEFRDVGACRYLHRFFNGGSVFWSENSADIVAEIVKRLDKTKKREEPTLNEVLSSADFASRVTVLNETYNVGCSGFVKRYLLAQKPIIACHFNPYNRIAWETHCLDRNGLGYRSVSKRLEILLRKYFPHLAVEISEEGRKARERHRERATRKYAELIKKEKETRGESVL
jgi:hypothetical protein